MSKNNSSSKIYMNLRNRKIIKNCDYIKRKYIRPTISSSDSDKNTESESCEITESNDEDISDSETTTSSSSDNNIKLKISDKEKKYNKYINQNKKSSNDDNVNLKNYRKMLSQLYPSKYINKKVEDTPDNIFLSTSSKIKTNNSNKRIKCNSSIKNKRHKISDNDYNKIISDDDKSEDIIQNNNKIDSDSYTKSMSSIENESENENENEDDETYSYEEETQESEEETDDDEQSIFNHYRKNKMNMLGKNKNFKIYFTLDYKNLNKSNDDEDVDTDSIIIDNSENEEIESEEDKHNQKNNEDDYENKKESKKEKYNKCKRKTENEIYDENEIQIEKLKGSTNKKDIKQLNRLEKINKNIRNKRIKHQLNENVNYFKKLLINENNVDDLKYFKKFLSYEQQMDVISQLEEINKYSSIEKPYQFILLETDIPIQYKACAMRRLNQLKNMYPGEVEYHKIKNWVDTFMTIPFGVYKTLPVTLDDGIDKCHGFMDNAKRILDETVFGLDDAKIQIMQMIGQWISNPDAMGTAIAIKGPMGTGKTTLVKDGISKILNREFAFIALGGASDSSFLEGHSYTYEGSTWGKIVDILIKCKSMNPVIYFDELDKISQTPRGEEIIGILTHLTDTTQNSKFHDRYFSEVEFNLSKCLFIFSYNDESKVNPILLDRMYKINTDGYNKEEKIIISNNHLIPKICEQIKFKKDDIIFSNETLNYIIDNYTEGEDGVRNLKRCLENIYTKLNLCRLLKQETNLLEKDLIRNVTFPIDVTCEMVYKLIKKPSKQKTPYGMYT
jgi:ATP-dependent Lon protease